MADGKPHITGRRITVQDIALWHEYSGQTVHEIAANYDLTLAQIHAALAYYFDNREAVDRDIKKSQDFINLIKSQTSSKLNQLVNE